MTVPDPELSLATTPTPIERMDTLSDDTGSDLYVKRDDMTGSIVQGNKVRKLEYILGAALREGADTVITCGGIQSNHCRTTAVTARQVGLDVHLLLRGEEPDVYDGNHLLDHLVGAEIEYVTDEQYYDNREEMLRTAADRLCERGRNPYVIPAGGSSGLGILGYVRAYQEIAAYADAHDLSFDAVYTAVGSGGTYAGLLGGAILEDDDTSIIGVNVSTSSPDGIHETVTRTLTECAEKTDGLSFDPDRVADRISIRDGYIGPGYAVPSTDDLETIARVGREEGLILDTCYTGKAFRGFLEDIDPDTTNLFVHTGGSYGIFPLRETLSEALSDH